MKGKSYSAEELAEMKAAARRLVEQRTGATSQDLAANDAADDDVADDDTSDDDVVDGEITTDESDDESSDEPGAAGEDDGEAPDEDAEEKHSDDDAIPAPAGEQHAALPVHHVPLATLRPGRDGEGFRFQYSRMQYGVLQAEPPAFETGETEGLLNGLIAECASLLRDVAFRSACEAQDVDDRIRFLSAAEGLARTAAGIGDTVGRLRHGGAQPAKLHRHELIYRHETSLPPSGDRR